MNAPLPHPEAMQKLPKWVTPENLLVDYISEISGVDLALQYATILAQEKHCRKPSRQYYDQKMKL